MRYVDYHLVYILVLMAACSSGFKSSKLIWGVLVISQWVLFYMVLSNERNAPRWKYIVANEIVLVIVIALFLIVRTLVIKL